MKCSPQTLLFLCAGGLLASCAGGAADATPSEGAGSGARPESNRPAQAGEERTMSEDGNELEVATLGAGCFWCVEAVLEQVKGVEDVESGYMGGHVENPTYEQVCSKTTGHAEVVQVTFDPKVLPYEHLLAWFWKLHDPTTLDRQGNDVGPQYRSAIFTHSEEQARIAKASKEKASEDFKDPIVTEITPASTFWPAEGYHQDYYRANREAGYCRFVIAPKLEKLDLEK